MYCGLQCGPREPPIQPVSTGIRRGVRGEAGGSRRAHPAQPSFPRRRSRPMVAHDSVPGARAFHPVCPSPKQPICEQKQGEGRVPFWKMVSHTDPGTLRISRCGHLHAVGRPGQYMPQGQRPGRGSSMQGFPRQTLPGTDGLLHPLLPAQAPLPPGSPPSCAVTQDSPVS